MSETVRVVLCGDEGVGKSSLVTALIKDALVPCPQRRLAPISIARDSLRRPDAPDTVLVDTTPTDREQLLKELKRAHVIWLVYADHYTCERVTLFWMPLFRSMGINLPIVLTANKADLNPGNVTELASTVTEFKEIEACIRASAKTKYNVLEALYLCHKAVVYPVAPLFDSKDGSLKPAAVQALKRVFYLSDRDHDGTLNASELAQLQRRCFDRDLDMRELWHVISVLRPDSPSFEMSRDVSRDVTVSEDDFLLLIKVYIAKGRHETVWGILRAFNYTDSLSLHALTPTYHVPRSHTVELSPGGYRFLVELFILFDKDKDGGLSASELALLLRPTPGLPSLWEDARFPLCTVRNDGHVTLQGWLAMWSMTTCLAYQTTLAYLLYLGFEGSPFKSVRNARNSAKTDKMVFYCLVLGSPGCGKTSLLNAFLGQPFSEAYSPTLSPSVAVNSVEFIGGKQGHLILEEPVSPVTGLDDAAKLDACNVLCMAYDSSDPDSFAYLEALMDRYPLLDRLPVVFVALKADLDRQQQRSQQQPDAYTRDLNLAPPLHVSVRWQGSHNELFAQLAEAARAPATATPHPDKEQKRLPLWPAFAVSLAVVSAAYGVRRLLAR